MKNLKHNLKIQYLEVIDKLFFLFITFTIGIALYFINHNYYWSIVIWIVPVWILMKPIIINVILAGALWIIDFVVSFIFDIIETIIIILKAYFKGFVFAINKMIDEDLEKSKKAFENEVKAHNNKIGDDLEKSKKH